MNTFKRWAKFNAVGILGMAVQLGLLAILNHAWPGHYLITTAVALELTLLHNITWHRRYTWRDRRHQTTWPQQALRFHISNGLTSLVGNLLLMRLLVHTAHVPVVAANAIAIIVCSTANFYLSNHWAFFQPKAKSHNPRVPHSHALFASQWGAQCQTRHHPNTRNSY